MSLERNQNIIAAITTGHMSPTQAAKHYGLSKARISQLVKAWNQDGVTGITPKTTAHHHTPNRISEQTRQQIINLRKTLETQGFEAGPQTIAYHLNQQGHTPPSTSSIYRILKNAGLTKHEPKKRPKSSYTRFEATLPNECWQSDVTYWHLADGTRIEILEFLDDATRYMLHYSAHYRVGTQTLLHAFKQTITKYGPPQSTLTDNGRIYTARYAGGKPGTNSLNAFEKYLATHSIKQKNGLPGHPTTQGKIERSHQPLKKWLKAQGPIHTLEQLNQLLNQWRHYYNHTRPHRSQGQKPPAHRYHTLPKATPQPLNQQEEYRTRNDKVCEQGTITIRYKSRLKHLGIGRTHKGKEVTAYIENQHVIVVETNTGEILSEHYLDPTKNYQPRI